MDIGAKRCFVFDLDGTVYLGDDPIPGTVAFIRRNLAGKDIYFLTNNTSKSLRDYARKLDRLGIAVDLPRILSPLLPLVEHLEAEGIRRICPVGNAAFRDYLKERLPDLVFTEGDDCEAVVLAYDTELTYAKLAASALLLQRPEVRFFATHPDLVCPSPRGPLPDVGSFLKLYEAATGRVPEIVFGKPDPRVLEGVLRRHGRDATVMVGDRLSTDFRLAENAGIDFILVLSGEATRADLPRLAHQPALVVEDLGAF